MSNLAALIDLVEAELKDTSNTNWSVAELTNHVRRALRAYNRVDPVRTAGALASVAGQREYDLSSLSNLMEVLDVWYPYDDSDPAYLPNRPRWCLIRRGYLYLDVADAPSGDADEKIRVFYTIPHTVEDLDSATETTLDGQGEELVVMGASAFAAQQYGQSLIGTVTVSGWTPEQLTNWASQRMQAFQAGLEELRRRAILAQDGRVHWGGAI